MSDKPTNTADNSSDAQEKRERELHEQSLSSNDPVEGRADNTRDNASVPGQGGLSTDEPAEGDSQAAKK